MSGVAPANSEGTVGLDRATIAVHPIGPLDANPRLFELLGCATGTRFAPLGPGSTAPHGLIVVGSGHEPLIASAAAHGLPVAVLGDRPWEAASDVVLADQRWVPASLRGQAFPEQRSILPVMPDPDSDVLASGPAGPVWSRRRDGRIHRIGSTLPPARTADVLRTLLGPDDRSHTFAVIALLEFLRAVNPPAWAPAPLRATFQFDDPNLRSRRYGHIDYRRLVAHADLHGYHASIAMIPLDAGRPGSATVALFRARPDRVSLVMHGNDHRHRELLRTDRYDTALELGTQALRRIERFETRTDLEVGRVMVPPHGMCSREVAAALATLRYDCLCSLHPAPWTERPPASLPLAGFGPATFVSGCSVLPRVPLDDRTSELAVRAYLGQALVLYGHHDDLADGYDILARVAERVARLGPVRWCPLAGIARTNYQLRMVGDTAEILPWSNRLDVQLPPGARRVSVVSPPHTDPDWLALRGWRLTDEHPGRCRELGASVPAPSDGLAAIRLVPSTLMPTREPAATSVHPLVWARRRAAELRDRAAPLSGHFSRHPTLLQ